MEQDLAVLGLDEENNKQNSALYDTEMLELVTF